MFVRFTPFGFNAGGKKMTNAQLLERLVRCGEGGEFELNKLKRFFYLKELVGEDYYGGLLVSIKSHKKVPKVNNNNQISLMIAGDDERIMDFNYFVLHKSSFRGVYQHYHNSCSLGQFGIFLKHRHEQLRHEMAEKDLKEEASKTNSKFKDEKKDKALRKAKKSYGSFALFEEATKDSLEERLSALERISSFEYCVSEIQEIESEMLPASDHASKIYHKATYKKQKKRTRDAHYSKKRGNFL